MSQTDPLLQLVFRSVCETSDGPGTAKSIAAGAQAETTDGPLTGFLALFGTDFVGLLEGPAAHVVASVEKISADTRNSGLCVLREAQLTDRRFTTWNWFCLPVELGDGDALANLFAERMSRALHNGA